MTEREPLRIDHPDSTLTIYGAKDQSLNALRSPSQLVSEKCMQELVQKASLPFKGKTERIVGWGGFSVAVRLNSPTTEEDNPQEHALVLRPLTGRGVKETSRLVASWKQELAVNQQFTPFTIPQGLVLSSGINGTPTAIKVAKEVEGATFNEASLLAILGNPHVLRQYVQFCKRAISIFITEGKLVDTSGHLAKNMLRQLWIGMVPFRSDNLIIEYGSNRLFFVDCDVKPSIHFFDKADSPQKLGLLTRSGFIIGTALAARVFALAHGVRNSLVEEKYTRKEVGEIRTEEYQNFIGGLEQTIQALNSTGIDYRVVGSIAMAGTIQSAGGEFCLTPTRINRTTRDIDIIVTDKDPEKSQAAGNLLKDLSRQAKTSKGFPEISVLMPIEMNESTTNFAAPHDRLLPTEFSRPGIDREGNIYLVYRDLLSKIPKRNLRPVTVTYEGIEFPTVEPGTLAGFALTRGGGFKLKDLEKIAVLSSYTNFRIPPAFRDFAQTIRRRYPSLYKNFLIREWLCYWSGGFISGGQITRFINWVRKFKETPPTY